MAQVMGSGWKSPERYVLGERMREPENKLWLGCNLMNHAARGVVKLCALRGTQISPHQHHIGPQFGQAVFLDLQSSTECVTQVYVAQAY